MKINEDFIGDIRTQHKSGRTTVDVIIDSDSKVRFLTSCKFCFSAFDFFFEPGRIGYLFSGSGPAPVLSFHRPGAKLASRASQHKHSTSSNNT